MNSFARRPRRRRARRPNREPLTDPSGILFGDINDQGGNLRSVHAALQRRVVARGTATADALNDVLSRAHVTEGEIPKLDMTLRRLWDYEYSFSAVLVFAPLVLVVGYDTLPFLYHEVGRLAHLAGLPRSSNPAPPIAALRYLPTFIPLIYPAAASLIAWWILPCPNAFETYRTRARYRLVDALVRAAVLCGSTGSDTVRPVQEPVKLLKRMVWKHIDIPRYRRKDIQAHVKRVVATLRAAEGRLDADPAAARRELLVLLLTIAENYSREAYKELLPAEQLVQDDPHQSRDRLWILPCWVAGLAMAWGTTQLSLPAPLDSLGPLGAMTVPFMVRFGIERGGVISGIFRGQ
ncbi:hypothetical protein ACWDRR_42110 [Kitasatospora sp. NPDC003701]